MNDMEKKSFPACKKAIMTRILRLVVMTGFLAASCTGPGFAPSTTETPIPTATAVPTQTPVPITTATPAPDFGIDPQKFTQFPESYEYLLTHLDEYVQAPDPLTDRADFESWWNEEFIPVVGEVTHEREVDVIAGSYSIIGNQTEVGPYWDNKVQYLSMPQFFYFIHQGTIYAVPVTNIQTLDYTPGMTNVTMAVILCDTTDWTATNALGRLSAGEDFERISIYTDRIGNYDSINQFIDAGFVAAGDINDPKMAPLFGPGRITFGSEDFIND